MAQYPSSSPNPPASYGGQPQQPAAPEAAPRSVRVALPSAYPYVTYTIIGLTVVVFLLQYASVRLFGYANPNAQMDWLEAFGACMSDAIRQGQFWRFLTPLLLHASVPHIGFNMYALLIFGVGLERSFGHWRYLLLYLLGGFTGNVLSFLFLPSSDFSVGASTAIFGLVAAEGIFLVQNRELFGSRFRSAIGNIVFIIVVNLVIGRVTLGIDNWGHVGGLLGGLIFAWFASPKWEVEGMAPALRVVDRREPRDVITGVAIVVLIFCALALWGLIR